MLIGPLPSCLTFSDRCVTISAPARASTFPLYSVHPIGDAATAGVIRNSVWITRDSSANLTSIRLLRERSQRLLRSRGGLRDFGDCIRYAGGVVRVAGVIRDDGVRSGNQRTD